MEIEASTLKYMLSGDADPLERMTWLRDKYFPEIVDRLNRDDVRKRVALYGGDRIPDNERNLTDFRNRISLIVEYELARVSNELLAESDSVDAFWTYVVANRFPDLEVRFPNGSRSIRVEVKCLQSVAEEKSANFDTLKKDINPNTDYVVVFLWEWDSNVEKIDWDRAPRIEGAYVFHAHSLAELRDTYWLNRPPANLGGGYQGFDLRYAVNCSKGEYNEEEGNYGKLLRAWDPHFPYRPPESAILSETEQAYTRFKSHVIEAGFSSRCRTYLPQIAPGEEPETIRINGELVGYRAGKCGMLLWPRLDGAANAKKARARQIMEMYQLEYLVSMNEKYVCSGYINTEYGLNRQFDRVKPKSLSEDKFSQNEN